MLRHSPPSERVVDAYTYLLRRESHKNQRKFHLLLLAIICSSVYNAHQLRSLQDNPHEEIRKAELARNSWDRIPNDTGQIITDILAAPRKLALEPFVWEDASWESIIDRSCGNAIIRVISTGLQSTYTTDNKSMIVETKFPKWGILEIKIGAIKIRIDIGIRETENPETYFQRILFGMRSLPVPIIMETLDAIAAFYPYVSDRERHGTVATNLRDAVYSPLSSVERAKQAWSAVLFGDCDDKAQIICYCLQQLFPDGKAYIIYLCESKGDTHHVAVLFQKTEHDPIYWIDGSGSDSSTASNFYELIARKWYKPAYEALLPPNHILYYTSHPLMRHQASLSSLFWWIKKEEVQ